MRTVAAKGRLVQVAMSMDCNIFCMCLAVIVLSVGCSDGVLHKDGLPRPYLGRSRANAATLQAGKPHRHPGVNSAASAAAYLASNFSIFNGKYYTLINLGRCDYYVWGEVCCVITLHSVRGG